VNGRPAETVTLRRSRFASVIIIVIIIIISAAAAAGTFLT